MAKNWRMEITGDNLTPWELNYNYLLDAHSVSDALNYAVKNYFNGFRGSGGKFWTQLVAKFGEAEAHHIVSHFAGGGGDWAEGSYVGGRAPTYRPPALPNEVPKPDYGRGRRRRG